MADDLATARPCLHLRCKEMFYKDPAAAPSAHDADVRRLFGACDTRTFWCDCTQTGRGPDGRPAGAADCARTGRTCYRGLAQLA